MRSNLIYGDLSPVENRYMLCQLVSKATRKFHRPATRVQDTMNQVLKQFADARAAEKVMSVEEPLAEARAIEQNARDRKEIKKRSVIGHQQNRLIMIDRLDVLETVDMQQVVTREMNPARPEHALAPRPETLPATQIHAVSEAESKAFEGRENGELFRSWQENL